MESHTFVSKIISGHRVTIRKDIYEDLKLEEGQKVEITLKFSRKEIASRGMDVML